jgi:hypothetical protein
MNFANRKLSFLTTAMVLVTGMKFGGSVHADTPRTTFAGGCE